MNSSTAYVNTVIVNSPKRLVFGAGCLSQFVDDFAALGLKRLFVLTVPSVNELVASKLDVLRSKGVSVEVNMDISSEPYFSETEKILAKARLFEADSVVGIGGGSVMDVAKVVAAQLYNSQSLSDIVGNGMLSQRSTWMSCIPTTSGTGSEVSPNSLLSDDSDGSKKGIISPFLVPDATYVDPELTLGLPAAVTAFTGLDALTHCIEAYTNKFAHPLVDTYALEGIRLIGRNLKKAFDKGSDIEARSKVALGSMYGGMCLGPVNTAAVHALAYPLGTDFKMAHGLSNALLLPYIMEYNISAVPSRYADVAIALGAEPGANDTETAMRGVALVRQLVADCNVPSRLSEVGVSKNDIKTLAEAAIKVQRLLKNNPKDLSLDEIVNVYTTAY